MLTYNRIITLLTQPMRIIKFLIPLSLIVVLLYAFSPEEAGAKWPPNEAHVNGVVGHAQQWNLSCESRSASDFAAFFGVDVSEAQVLAYVTKNPRTDNPNYGFVGNPNGSWGQIPPNAYGVHSNPIEGALLSYGLTAYGERNLTWDFLRSEIAYGRPVIVWIIGSMWPGTPVQYTDSLGRKVIVAAYEHSVILVGYNKTTVWVVDSADGLTKSYPLSSFLNSWSVLENQAVFFHEPRPDYPNKIYLPISAHADE